MEYLYYSWILQIKVDNNNLWKYEYILLGDTCLRRDKLGGKSTQILKYTENDEFSFLIGIR